MIWGHFGMYVLYLITDGAYRGVRVGAKIAKGVIGRARQAASRARSKAPAVHDYSHGYGTGKTMLGTDPSGLAGGTIMVCPRQAGKRVIHDEGRSVMQRFGIGTAGEIQSPERPSAGLSEVSGYPRTNPGCEDAQGPVLAREGASEPEPLPPLDGALHSEEDGDLVEPEDGGECIRVVLEGDPDYNDLQTYLEGGSVESTEAARRLDQRGVDQGQLSPKTFWDTWGEEPVRSELPHQIWCARWKNHPVAECPVWGAE